MPRAFVMRPFGIKKDSKGAERDFESVHTGLIEPALLATGFGGGTAGEIIDAGNIREDMFALIIEADLVICDVTIPNANVFYELGIRHALRKKRTVMIKGRPSDPSPFDLQTDRYLAYDLATPADSKGALIDVINATMSSDRETDSPVFKMLPALLEVDPDKVVVVPLDFREEVERAVAARSKGWLRLLSEEVRQQRFQWVGLKLIGRAQLELKDNEGARSSYEAIRERRPSDLDANLALANAYERMGMLELSDQAIQRVLDSNKPTRTERAEALALAGRNQKTRWRAGFDKLGELESRRAAATSRSLIRAYEDYRKAFFQDLNHAYPGLATLQMGSILVALSGGEDWKDAFDTDPEAEKYKQDLVTKMETLRHLVLASVEGELQRRPANDPDRYWTLISVADVLFLTERRDQRVVSAYIDAIPVNNPFAWDSARRQLELFASLGFKAELVGKVIAAVSEKMVAGPKAVKPLHAIVLGGHRIDEPGRTAPRFPASREAHARALLKEKLTPLVTHTHDIVALASAASGADILAHELCAELGLKSTVCLPMPSNDYAAQVFGNLDDWRRRFLPLKGSHPILELSDRPGLPRWLEGSGMNAWERGNRWVLQMAQTLGADKISLVALWDGELEQGAPGGTAHLVKLARGAGNVDVHIADAKKLTVPE